MHSALRRPAQLPAWETASQKRQRIRKTPGDSNPRYCLERPVDAGLDLMIGRLQNGGNVEDNVATLNVKNLSDALYRKLQARARRERRSVAQEVTKLLSDALESPRQLSILDLKGLGKDHWKEIEATEHVRKERAEWD
jgi:plasmid stability protein